MKTRITELFGIDGEAFLRSTYMPQSHDNALNAMKAVQINII